MNPELATGLRALADAAIARVHGEGPTPRDGHVLVGVLNLAQNTLNVVRSGIDRLTPSLEKAAECGVGASLSKMVDEFTKAADGIAETVELLKAVAAEPQDRIPEPWSGAPLHLRSRALTFTSPTAGSA